MLPDTATQASERKKREHPDVEIYVSGLSHSEAGANADSNSQSTASSESTSGSTASSDNSVTINEVHPDDIRIRNVSSPDTPNVYPSAPCRVAVSAGLSLAGGALSGGSSYEDPECTLRETARAFHALGVPEVGLLLLCKNSVVITGRKNKRGELEPNEPDPIGTAECLRFVREFQGSPDESDISVSAQTQLEVIREQQDRTEREVATRIYQLEQKIEEKHKEPVHPPVVRQEVIQQPYLDDVKRAKLEAVLRDNEEDEK